MAVWKVRYTMLLLITYLLIISFLFMIGLQLTGAIIKAFIWLFVSLPLAAVFGLLGILCCCTLILIPLGLGLLKASLRMLIPG
ncbi:MAG: hypothetical protein Q4B09_01875 [Lachnospiraceae bacterium]|nr:hypothetical protein [Lachnospiraceae bacterium]